MSVKVEERYHVPPLGKYESRRGNVHLHVMEPFVRGRVQRAAGETLCSKRRGRHERLLLDAHDHELTRCRQCDRFAKRYRIEWPSALSGMAPSATIVDEVTTGMPVVVDGRIPEGMAVIVGAEGIEGAIVGIDGSASSDTTAAPLLPGAMMDCPSCGASALTHVTTRCRVVHGYGGAEAQYLKLLGYTCQRCGHEWDVDA